MKFYALASLALASSIAATPITLNVDNSVINTREALNDFIARHNLTFVPCSDTSTDPKCKLVQRPIPHVLSSTLLKDGSWSAPVKSNWTRETLAAIRKDNNVTSNDPNSHDPIAIRDMMAKRESAPQICNTESQQWYDTENWGYWYQPWRQVGNCFYCGTCSDSIAVGFSVTDTFTFGLSIKFNDVISATFSFSNAQTSSITETRTCNWSQGSSNGCHTIWYQPLMVWHNGWPNYQTHSHCYAGAGLPASDSYYDHNWAFANVNQGAQGTNQGNLGCDSGCGGFDGRSCQPNSGGSLWPWAN